MLYQNWLRETEQSTLTLHGFVAKRMGATTYELDSSHAPMLSQPDLVLDVIRAAAKSLTK